MAEVISFLYQFANVSSFLFLCAAGLVIILGMMNVINLAHGHLMMIGAYIATIFYSMGVPFVVTVLLAFIGGTLLGALLEFLVVRRFYGQELSVLVVTWGIGLIISQGLLLIFGPFMPPIPSQLGTFTYAGVSFSAYRLVLIAVSVLLLVFLWWVFHRTTIGLMARATMQNAAVARSLGIHTGRMYALTFAFGSGLAGLSGALLAPLTSIAPDMAMQYVAPAFITVVIGGPTNVIAGAAGSSLFLSAIQTPVSLAYGAFLGTVAMLLAALIIIRVLPSGIAAYMQTLSEYLQRLSYSQKGRL